MDTQIVLEKQMQNETAVQQVMRETGMGELQAKRHLEQHQTLINRLRDHIQTIRRKPTPIADLIPLLAESADRIEQLERQESNHLTTVSKPMVSSNGPLF